MARSLVIASQIAPIGGYQRHELSICRKPLNLYQLLAAKPAKLRVLCRLWLRTRRQLAGKDLHRQMEVWIVIAHMIEGPQGRELTAKFF